MPTYIYRLCIKLYSIKGTFKICVVWILNVLMEKSTYTIHLYKYKNTRIGLCIIFLLSFSFTKVLYVQTIARDGGTVYCITIIIFHVSLFSTRPVSVLGPCMCRLWPMAGSIHAKYKKPMRARLPHGQVAKPKQIKRARRKSRSRRGVRPVAR